MGRTVKVDLILDAMKAVRGAREFSGATDDMGDSLEDAGRQADRTGKLIDAAGEDMNEAARAAALLDRQIDELTESLRQLAIAEALTGDKAFTKQIAEQEAALARLNKSRRRIGPLQAPDESDAVEFGAQIGVDAARGFFARFTMDVTKLATSPAGLAAGTLIGVPLGVVAGSAVAAGIVGGAGTAGVVGGVALASRDPRVKSAASALKTTISSELEFAARPFVPATLAAISTVRKGFEPMRADIRSIFADSATFLRPLTEGGLSGISRIVDSARGLVANAGPAVREFGFLFEQVGDAIGDVFDSLSDNGPEAAGAIRLLAGALSDVIRFGGDVVNVLTEMFGPMIDIAIGATEVADALVGWVPFTGGMIDDTRDRLLSVRAAMDDTTVAAFENRDGFLSVGEASQVAQRGLDLYRDTMNQFITDSQNAFNATTRFEEALDKAAEAAKNGADTLDANSEAGRANRDVLGALAGATTAAAGEARKLVGGQAEANRIMDRGYDAFVKAADGMGISRGQADKLARSLGLIPSPKVAVTVDTRSATNTVNAFVTRLQRLDGTVVTTYVKTVDLGGGAYRATSSGGGGRSRERWGGIYEHAQDGLIREGRLRDAAVYSPVGPARYAFAEPATQGEAFIPKRGDYGRSMSILNKAAGWYGAQVGPRGMTTVVHEHRIVIEGTGVLAGIREEIKVAGGDVQQVLGPDFSRK